jgi:glucose-6-phosphate isomerase
MRAPGPTEPFQTPAWQQLLERAAQGAPDVRRRLLQDPDQARQLWLQAPEVGVDFSRHWVDTQDQALLNQWALERNVAAARDAMFQGRRVNTTEQRAALHHLLRWPDGSALSDPVAGEPQGVPQALTQVLTEVLQARRAFLTYADRVRADAAMTDVVHLGIGGSELGPQLAVQALATPQSKRLHVVSSLDPQELLAVLQQIQPHSTLFVVASKSFATLETMTNARAAKAWFLSQGGVDVARHFVALTANTGAAAAFGISTCFGLWDWVGGRFSLWSAIGLPVAIALGATAFEQMLAGAHAMDLHFLQAPLAANLPVQLALRDVWCRNLHHMASRCVAPYAYGLRRLPAYLQQLEMESNGKLVDLQGQRLTHSTAPVVWGEPASNGQHAFFQLLHQGTDTLPIELVLVKRAPADLPLYMAQHQPELLANALAQAQALTQGQGQERGSELPPYRHLPGNRPCTTLVLEALTPRSLGALLALYEHRVVVQAALWGINPFDQWGVELGKTLAQNISEHISQHMDSKQTSTSNSNTSGLDTASVAMLARL